MPNVGEVSVDLVLEGQEEYRTDMTDLENQTRTKVRSISDLLGKFGIASVAVFGATILKMTTDLNGAFRAIEVGTGATGAELAQIESVTLDVLEEVPDSVDAVGRAVAALSTEFGLVDEELKEAAIAALTLSRNTDSDVIGSLDDLSQLTRALGDETSVVDLFNSLLVVQQDTGKSMSELIGIMLDEASTIRRLGLDVDGALGILRSVELAGLDVSEAFSALTEWTSRLHAETGTAAPILDSLREVLEESEDPTAILAALQRVFGDDAILLRDALADEIITIEDLTGAFEAGRNPLQDMIDRSLTLTETLGLMRNQVQGNLEPMENLLASIANLATGTGDWNDVLEETKDLLGGLAENVDFSVSGLFENVDLGLTDIDTSPEGLLKEAKKLLGDLGDSIDLSSVGELLQDVDLGLADIDFSLEGLLQNVDFGLGSLFGGEEDPPTIDRYALPRIFTDQDLGVDFSRVETGLTNLRVLETRDPARDPGGFYVGQSQGLDAGETVLGELDRIDLRGGGR